jgi:CrcB protein
MEGLVGRYIAVAVGGALGAMARYWVGNLVAERFPTRFPLGTLIINVSGSFIVGFFLAVVSERVNIHPNWKLAVAVGFVGAYTTFSTFEYETFRLLENGIVTGGLINVLASLILGFMAVWGGIVAGRELSKPAILARRSSILANAAVRPIPAVEPPNLESSAPSALDSAQDSGISHQDP